MYQSHFQLSSRPFASAPNPEHYFPAASIERARETLVMSIERAAGVTLVIGGVGTGKTLLCQLIANHFSRELPVCFLSSARICSRQALLKTLLHRLGLPFHNQDEGELPLTLADHIIGPSCPHGILLIIDEADRLPLELLEEIRVITNLVQEGEPQVRLMLAGGPRLEERISQPRMESLNQRIVSRLYLDTFSADETADYIRARITASGGVAQTLFTDDGLQAVFQATSGVPRLVNQVCDHALILAAVGKHSGLDASGIEEAWADLQQLPLPPRLATHSLTDRPSDDVVEFGPLDDMDESGPLDDMNEETAAEGAHHKQPLLDPEHQQEEEIERQVAAVSMEMSADLAPSADSRREDPSFQNVEDTKRTVFDDEEFKEAATTTIGPHIFAEPTSESDNTKDVRDWNEDVNEEVTQHNEPSEVDPVPANAELTVQRAANPFDEEFELEEVVIQQFAAPSDIAHRMEEHQVSSAYSQVIARQLTAAHPGLCLHSDDNDDTVELTLGKDSEFRPLSACVDDDLEADVLSKVENLDFINQDQTEIETNQTELPVEVASETGDDGSDSDEAPHSEGSLEEASSDTSPLENLPDEQPEVVVQFHKQTLDWSDDRVMPDAFMAALSPEAKYQPQEHLLVEEIPPEEYSPAVQELADTQQQNILPPVTPHEEIDGAVIADVNHGTPSNTELWNETYDLPPAQTTSNEASAEEPDAPKEDKPKSFRRLFSGMRQG